MKKRRISLKLEGGEAAVVAPLVFWESIEGLFRDMAKDDPEYAHGWREAAAHIREWTDRTRDNREFSDGN